MGHNFELYLITNRKNPCRSGRHPPHIRASVRGYIQKGRNPTKVKHIRTGVLIKRHIHIRSSVSELAQISLEKIGVEILLDSLR